MSWGTPWALALAALAVPVLAAFLSRNRVVRRHVSSLEIYRVLQEQVELQRAMALPHHWLSLLLVLLALALGVVAIAEPRSGPPAPIVVVVDTSSSMATVERRGTRLALAQDHVRASLRRLGSDAPVTLVQLSDAPVVVAGPTLDHRAINDAVAEMVPAGGADLPSAAALVDGLCANGGVVWVSDRAPPELACPVQHLAVGTDQPNLALTDLSVRETDGLGLFEVQVRVVNHTPAPLDVDVRLEDDSGALLDVIGLHVPAGQAASRSVRRALAPGSLHAVVAGQDANPLDDAAHIELTAREPANVLLVTDLPQGFLARALALHPTAALTVAAPDAIPADPVHLVVLETPAAAPLPVAQILAFGVPLDGIQVVETVRTPDITRWDFGHPLLRFVDLDGLGIGHAQVLQGGTPLVESGAGPVAVDTGAAWLFGWDPQDSDLVLRSDLLNVLANAVEISGPAWVPPVSAGSGDADLSVSVGPSDAGVVPGVVWWRWALLAAGVLLLAEGVVPWVVAVQDRRRRVALGLSPETPERAQERAA